MAEVLAPTRLNIATEYARGFEGMTETAVTLDELLDTREELIAPIVGEMPIKHRTFLLSVKHGNPDWALLGLPAIEALPAVRWKLENLAKLSTAKRAALAAVLGKVLNVPARSSGVRADE
jgi:hypothetical protein